ncbi:MAG TPA: sodium:glutamate symporter [Bacillus bacterium]|uniref:Sodium:glutamate symporter n=1 Tax=Siminovitchia fordii TaxID=254759 RepID=A0ABQ4K1A0_9BACI|nr:sodium/glutamate symporter [Siminovitchia fordii]GIN19531.1 sodium:glutamate symporter [Siminovitchia fordii]HBZ11599.1 sodium:glutamate symporter [Bacillus sp. (in: firmicutes)]
MTLYTLLVDFTLASILILLSMLMRSKIKFLQKNFIPASLLAGFLGLALGPGFLNILPFSGEIGSYAGVIIIFVFASVGINGFSFSPGNMKKDLNRMGAYASYKILIMCAIIFIPVVFSILVISKWVPEINYGFGLLLATGFYGGHGTAAAVGSTFESLGFSNATDLAMTSATVGILVGIFGGLIFIKMATKKGYTQYVKDFSQISEDMRTGLVKPENRPSIGKGTISPIALDPIAFHLGLLLIPSGLGYLLNTYIADTWGLDFPTFTIAFIVALVMYALLGKGKKGVYKYVDEEVVNRLGSSATDYLVFFGVASIKLPIVLEYALPLGLLMLSGLIIVVLLLWVAGPAMNYESWFERSIFVYGYATGVFAIGLTLLRVVDPRNKSKTITDTAIVGPLNTPIELFAWSAGPAMLLGGQHWAFVGIFAVISILCIVISIKFKWWYWKIPLAERPDASALDGDGVNVKYNTQSIDRSS